MLVKGDKIRLVKPMGMFTNVGEVCHVLNVAQNGDITFMFGNGMHKGYMSENEFNTYFEKVEQPKMQEGDRIRLAKENRFLSPMRVGDEFSITSMNWGVVWLEKNPDERFAISENLLFENFEKVEEKVENNIVEAIDYIEELINHSQINITKVFDKCTIVAVKLPNGFVIVESSSCVDPEDYDEEIGVEICLSRIKMRIAEMEAYASHEEMAYGCDCECGCDCDECPFEDDEDNDNIDCSCDNACKTCDCGDCETCDHEAEYRRKKH